MNTRNFFKGNNSDKLKLYSKLEVNVKASEEEIKKKGPGVDADRLG
jgi:DnaJ-class molecular chaperone